MDEHRVPKSRCSKNCRKNGTEKHRDPKRNWFAEIKKGKLDNRGYGINNSATAAKLSHVISNEYQRNSSAKTIYPHMYQKYKENRKSQLPKYQIATSD